MNSENSRNKMILFKSKWQIYPCVLSDNTVICISKSTIYLCKTVRGGVISTNYSILLQIYSFDAFFAETAWRFVIIYGILWKIDVAESALRYREGLWKHDVYLFSVQFLFAIMNYGFMPWERWIVQNERISGKAPEKYRTVATAKDGFYGVYSACSDAFLRS